MPFTKKSPEEQPDKPLNTDKPAALFDESIFDNTQVEIRAYIPQEMKNRLLEVGALYGGLSISELVRFAFATFISKHAGSYDVLMAHKMEETGLTSEEICELIVKKYEEMSGRKRNNLSKK